ncbi:MAG: methionine biosynthesis protein MetW [Halobacteriota archaeon]
MQRYDHDIITRIIPIGSGVLDLGCGNGDLLLKLKQRGIPDIRGVEIDDRCIAACVRKGLTVFHGDIDEGLSDYDDSSFDYVVLNQALQVVHKPTLVLTEMLRVGDRAIVSFPNFGYFKVRWYLLTRGRMPKTDFLPKDWYDTSNIHLLTISDFEAFCRAHNIMIEQAIGLRNNASERTAKHFKNLLCQVGIFVIKSNNGHSIPSF